MMMRALSAGGMSAAWDPSRDELALERFQLVGRMVNPDHRMFEVETRRAFTEPGFYDSFNGKLIKAVAFDVPRLVETCSLPLHVVFMHRPIGEVEKSFRSFLHEDEAGALTVNLKKLFKERKKRALKLLQAYGAEIVSLDFENVLRDPGEALTRLRMAGWPIDVSRAVAEITPGWRNDV